MAAPKKRKTRSKTNKKKINKKIKKKEIFFDKKLNKFVLYHRKDKNRN
ncbi:50S ribosomal protein L32 [Candidatus Vidania fulgoroideorum]